MQPSIPIQPNESDEVRALRKLADLMGWSVRSTNNGDHSANSLHKEPGTNGIGLAVDLAALSGPSADSPSLLAIDLSLANGPMAPLIAELIYAGRGNICMKNGVVVDGIRFYGTVTMSEHHNHVHLGVHKGFTYNTPPSEEPEVAKAIVAAFPTNTNKGYWLIDDEGHVFAFGDAQWFGGTHIDENGNFQADLPK